MSISSVTLVPGIDVERTLTLNEAGYSSSQLMRWKEGLAQKIGGWTKFYNFALGGIVRALHAWQDLNDTKRLAAGSTTELDVITSAGVLSQITPQAIISDFTPEFETTSASSVVVITDPNVTDITTFDSIFFNTPISVGGLILSGLYPVNAALGGSSYNIDAGANATTTRTNVTISAITQANPGVVTYVGADNLANGDLIYIADVVGMTQVNNLLFTIANLNTGANTFELSGVDTTAYTAYSSGGVATTSVVPFFATTSGSTEVDVTFPDHGVVAGDTFVFPIATTGGGVTIQGTYTVVSVGSVDEFTVRVSATATSTAAFGMNGGDAELVYYISLGPAPAGTGYGVGGYGDGGYGLGTTPVAQTGTPITATDWSLDNWGEILLACPANGGIYYWQPSGGFETASLITQAPTFNGGIFVAMPAQILVAWGASSVQTVGVDQDPLRVQWCDQGNFFEWRVLTTTQAGSFRIPNGSRIVGAFQGPQNALIWTDLSIWAMQYVGYPLVFGFNKIGDNCGLIARHAFAQMGGTIFWMGQTNFFALTGSGAVPLPCSVYDAVFQNLDTTNQHKCWAWPSTTFNEVWFFYPSTTGGTGECDRFVKLNTTENSWDYGILPRTAGIDQSVLGSPIASGSNSLIYQHEIGYNDDGQPLAYSWRTGYWSINDANEIGFVDWVFPDFKFGTFSGAQSASVQLAFYAVDYPGGPERTYGPYTVTASTTYINTRIRGRQLALEVSGNDLNSFVRLGRLRFRWQQDGRL